MKVYFPGVIIIIFLSCGVSRQYFSSRIRVLVPGANQENTPLMARDISKAFTGEIPVPFIAAG